MRSERAIALIDSKKGEMTKPPPPQLMTNWKGEQVPLWQYQILARDESGHQRKKRGSILPRVTQEKIRLQLRTGHTVPQIAKANQITINSVYHLMKEMPDVYENRRQERTEDIVNDIWDLSNAIVNSVTPEDITKASLKEKAIASSIFMEKAQLLSGNPTEIVQNNVSDRELIILARKAGIALPANVKERITRLAPEISDGEIVSEKTRQLPEAKQA